MLSQLAADLCTLTKDNSLLINHMLTTSSKEIKWEWTGRLFTGNFNQWKQSACQVGKGKILKVFLTANLVLNRSLLSKRLPLLRLLVYLNGNLLVALLNETSAAIGAWKCILQPFYWNNGTGRLGQREVALPIIQNSPRFQYFLPFLNYSRHVLSV